MEIVLGLLIIVALYYLVVYVIAPLAGIVATIIGICGAVYALFISSICFFPTVYKHKNPYTDETAPYVDRHKNVTPGTRRNYFFGPGLHQLKIIVSDSFKELSNKAADLGKLKSEYSSKFNNMIVRILIMALYGVTLILTYVFGGFFVGVFSVLLSLVLVLGMTGFFTFFGTLWAIDRGYLVFKSIQSRCGNCKRTFIVPMFICPDCGAEHFNLTPGPYGVIRKKCSCGRELPTTIFTGRSKLEAHCPFCYEHIASSDCRQYGFQLVGSTNSGKTTFLAAFWHEYLDKLKAQQHIEYECFPKSEFDKLEEHFLTGQIIDATSEYNANMYSVVHRAEGKTPYQISIYDIAGEAFASLETTNQQQQQFNYCEGIIMLIDPSDSHDICLESFNCFISNYRGLSGIKSSKLSDLPISVVISKSDRFKKNVGRVKIKTEYKRLCSQHNDLNHSEAISIYDSVRNKICRDFLVENGFDNLVHSIESEFSDIAYFSASSTGKEISFGESYEPWGVTEPVFHLMKKVKNL